jgi:hypothetical protein
VRLLVFFLAGASDRQTGAGVAAAGHHQFVLLAHFSGAPPDSTYVPAHIEDGKLIPGAEK